MTSKNFRAHLLYYTQLSALFQIHRWIQTEATVRKPSIQVKIDNLLSCVTLKFDGWPWKTIGHLFHTLSSFVHHFKTMVEFKLELQSRNSKSGSKSAFFFVPCDLEIWWMTLENNRAPLLYYIKICASFQSHGWIQTWDTVRKCSIRVKIGNFCPVRPWNLTDDLEKK